MSRALRMVVFLLAVCGAFVGGLVADVHLIAGAAPGVAVFGAGLWGWFVCCMAMAYWDACLGARPPQARADECPHLSVLDRLDGQKCSTCAPNRTIRHEGDR